MTEREPLNLGLLTVHERRDAPALTPPGRADRAALAAWEAFQIYHHEYGGRDTWDWLDFVLVAFGQADSQDELRTVFLTKAGEAAESIESMRLALAEEHAARQLARGVWVGAATALALEAAALVFFLLWWGS